MTTHFGKLWKDTIVEWENGKRATVRADDPIPGSVEGSFFLFNAEHGPARLPIICFKKIEKA